VERISIGVRGSICWSVLNSGAGAPVGVRLPCAKDELEKTTSASAGTTLRSDTVFIGLNYRPIFN
jgi:hypothetical protein